MKISVVIPTYNRANFVGKAIDSVLNQSAACHEIIVVDDGSTDGTGTALAAYAGKIDYIYQKNSGVSAARNEGIRRARGDWVAFLDSDDEWTSEYLSAQVMRAKKFPEAVVHLTNAVTVLPNGTRTDLFGETGLIKKFKAAPCLFLVRPLSSIIRHAPWFVQSAMLRRDVLFKVGLFDESLAMAEDLDVIAHAALEGPFTFSRAGLVEVHRRQEPILNLLARSSKEEVYRSFGKVYLKLLHARGLTVIERIVAARALSSANRALGNVLVLGNRKREARKHYRRSLFRYPSFRALIKFVGTFLPGGVSLALVRTGRDISPTEKTPNC